MTASTGEPSSAKIKRINCRNCGYRIRADAEVCPHCHSNPRARQPLPSNLLIAILLLLVLGFICALASQFLSEPLMRVAALGAKPQPTTVIQVIYTIATPAESSAPPRLAATPTAAPTPTRPPPTATDTGGPKLIAPANGASFTGADADITLEWQPVAGPLRENEWYVITIVYSARSGAAVTQSGWSRETRWNVKKDWWTDAAANARTFAWSVQLMRVEGADPFTSSTRTPITPASEVRKFVWQ